MPPFRITFPKADKADGNDKKGKRPAEVGASLLWWLLVRLDLPWFALLACLLACERSLLITSRRVSGVMRAAWVPSSRGRGSTRSQPTFYPTVRLGISGLQYSRARPLLRFGKAGGGSALAWSDSRVTVIMVPWFTIAPHSLIPFPYLPLLSPLLPLSPTPFRPPLAPPPLALWSWSPTLSPVAVPFPKTYPDATTFASPPPSWRPLRLACSRA